MNHKDYTSNSLIEQDETSLENSNEIDKYHQSLPEGLRAKKLSKSNGIKKIIPYVLLITFSIAIGATAAILIQDHLNHRNIKSKLNEPYIKSAPKKVYSTKKIRKVGICGTGTMGATVAKIFSEKGNEN